MQAWFLWFCLALFFSPLAAASIPDDDDDVWSSISPTQNGPDQIPYSSKRARDLGKDQRPAAASFLFGNQISGPYSLAIRDFFNTSFLTERLRTQGLKSIDREVLQALPSVVPVDGFISSTFGMRSSPFHGGKVLHKGIDIVASPGADVRAAADGVVQFANWRGPLGRVVVLDHGYGIKTKYAHNSKIHVIPGQKVRRGDLIAAVGNSGRSTGAHLHFEIRIAGKPVDPADFMFASLPEQPLKATKDGDIKGMGGDSNGEVVLPPYHVTEHLVANIGIIVMMMLATCVLWGNIVKGRYL